MFQSPQQGFIKFVLIIVILVVIMSLLHINLRGYLDDNAFKNNFDYVRNAVETFLRNVKSGTLYIWEEYLQPIITGNEFQGIRQKFDDRTGLEE